MRTASEVREEISVVSSGHDLTVVDRDILHQKGCGMGGGLRATMTMDSNNHGGGGSVSSYEVGAE